jgi:hypothetical protein
LEIDALLTQLRDLDADPMAADWDLIDPDADSDDEPDDDWRLTDDCAVLGLPCPYDDPEYSDDDDEEIGDDAEIPDPDLEDIPDDVDVMPDEIEYQRWAR